MSMDPATPLASSRAPHFTPASTARTRTPLSTPTRLSGAEGSRESQYMLKIGLGKRLNGQQQQGLKLARGIDALASIGWTLLEFYEAFFGTQDAVVTGWRNSIIKAPRTGQTYWLARLLPVVCEQATRAGARDAVATAITDQAAALLSHEVGAKIEDPALQRTASGATRATLGDPFVVGELHELFGNTFPLLVALINKVMGAPNRYERKQAATLLDKGSEPALGKRKGEKMPWGLVAIISIILFIRNRATNIFPCFLAMFLAASHTPRHVFDLLNRLGLSISYDSCHELLSGLSQDSKNRLRDVSTARPGYCNADNLDYLFRVDAGNESATHTRELKHVTMAAFHVFPRWVPEEAFSAEAQLEYERRRGCAAALSDAQLLGESKVERAHFRRVVTLHVAAALVDGLPSLVRTSELQQQLREALLKHRQSLPLHRTRPLEKTDRVPLGVYEYELGTDKGVEGFLGELVGQLHPSSNLPEGSKRPVFMPGDLLTVKLYRKARLNSFGESDPALHLSHVHTVPLPFHVALNLLYTIISTFYGGSDHSNPAGLHRHALDTHGRHLNVSHPDFRTATHLLRISYCARVLDCLRIALDLPDSDALAAVNPTSLGDVLDLAERVTRAFDWFGGSRARFVDVNDEVGQFAQDFLRTVTLYFEMLDAIKFGDFGALFDAYKRSIAVFRGGGATNYAAALLELHVQHAHELPESLRAAYEALMLSNPSGHADGFIATDLLLEGDVGEAKEWLKRARGTGSIPYLQSVAAGATDIHRAVRSAFVDAFRLPTHSRPHQRIPSTIDVFSALATTTADRVHEPVADRRITPPASAAKSTATLDSLIASSNTVAALDAHASAAAAGSAARARSEGGPSSRTRYRGLWERGRELLHGPKGSLQQWRARMAHELELEALLRGTRTSRFDSLTFSPAPEKEADLSELSLEERGIDTVMTEPDDDAVA